VRRRFAPPHTIWVLCPNKNGDNVKKREKAKPSLFFNVV